MRLRVKQSFLNPIYPYKHFFFSFFFIFVSLFLQEMSFMSNENADCGLIDPMSGLLKRFQQDRSLQQVKILFF